MSSIETKTNSYVDLDLDYSKKFIYNSNQDVIINIYGNNLLNQAIRNHTSLVKDHVPMPSANYGIDLSMIYKF